MRSWKACLYRLHNLFTLLPGQLAENPDLPCFELFATGCYVSCGRIQKNIDKFHRKTNDRYLLLDCQTDPVIRQPFFSDENNQQYSLTS